MLNAYFINTFKSNVELWKTLLEMDITLTVESENEVSVESHLAAYRIRNDKDKGVQIVDVQTKLFTEQTMKFHKLVQETYDKLTLPKNFNYVDYFDRIGIFADKGDYSPKAWESMTGIEFDVTRIVPDMDMDTPLQAGGDIRIFIDMDGTLCKFNEGKSMEEVFSSGYFRNLTPFPKMVKFAKILQEQGYEVNILSKSNFSETQNAIQEKIEWLQEQMPFIPVDNYYFVPLEADKKNFIPEPRETDILIDDYLPNLENWHGIPVLCINDLTFDKEKYTQSDYKKVYWNDEMTNLCVLDEMAMDLEEDFALDEFEK